MDFAFEVVRSTSANISLAEFLAVAMALAVAIIIGVVSANKGWFEYTERDDDDHAGQMAP